MHQIQLSNDLFEGAQRRATEAGFSSVDDFVAEVLRHELADEAVDFDRLFTPERLARHLTARPPRSTLGRA